jgi:DNA-binding XRE family transcriptional regulator
MKTRHHSALRLIRDATGLSQTRFGEKVGTNTDAIVNVESGRTRTPSDWLCKQVAAFTGAIPESVAGDPRDFNGRPYTEASFHEWNGVQYGEQTEEALIKLATQHVERLCRVALWQPFTGDQTAATFRSVLLALNDFLFEQVQTHGLRERLERHALKNAPRISGTSTVRECRKQFGKSPEWQKNADPKWTYSTPVDFIEIRIPVFAPFTGFFADVDGKPAFVSAHQIVLHDMQLTVNGKTFRVLKRETQMEVLSGKPQIPLPSKKKRKA